MVRSGERYCVPSRLLHVVDRLRVDLVDSSVVVHTPYLCFPPSTVEYRVVVRIGSEECYLGNVEILHALLRLVGSSEELCYGSKASRSAKATVNRVGIPVSPSLLSNVRARSQPADSHGGVVGSSLCGQSCRHSLDFGELEGESISVGSYLAYNIDSIVAFLSQAYFVFIALGNPWQHDRAIIASSGFVAE